MLRTSPFAALLLSLPAACAHRPAPPLHAARLVLREADGGGVVALVRAEVAGKPSLLVLDTGASQSVLSARFARARNLPSRKVPGAMLLDANGHRTPGVLLPDVPVRFEGETGAGLIDFAQSASRDLEAGFLAPQDLVRPGWAVIIDLGRGELRCEPEEAALERLAGTPLREVAFHGCAGQGPLPDTAHRLRIVRTTINGVPGELVLDTGASRTLLARNNPAIPSMESAEGERVATRGVTSIASSMMVPDVPVEFAGTPFVVAPVVSPTTYVCGHGLLGADILRHCTLVWGWSKLWVGCRAPGAAGAPPPVPRPLE